MAQALSKTAVMAAGYKALIAALGEMDAERFISFLLGEPFDYSKHRDIFLYDEGDENLTPDEFWEKVKRDTADDKTEFPPLGAAFKDPAIMAKLKAACKHPDAIKAGMA